jgi:GT2 family glycosyltransferase
LRQQEISFYIRSDTLKKNLVSVFIPSYNYARYLGAAIDSIIAQTYQDWELVIVDDASSDDSPAIIERYRRRYPDRIRSVLLDKNVGQSEASNIGFRMLDGEFIAPLAADDVARPERLAEGVAYLRRQPNVAAVFSRVGHIDADGRPVPAIASVFNQGFDDLRWRLLEGNFLCATTPLIRHSALREIGNANPNLAFVEDYDLWMRLLDRYELARVDDIWVDYRMHGENLSFAQNSRAQKIGPLYESVAVAVRAMSRWPLNRLHNFKSRPGTGEHRKETALVLVRLAETCMKLEQSFFSQLDEFGLRSPGMGFSAAYGFLLDALQNDSSHPNAKTMLREIYGIWGDAGRAAGLKSSTLGEMAALLPTHQSPAETNQGEQKRADELPEFSDYENWSRMLGLARAEAAQYDHLAEKGGLSTRFHLATILPPGAEDHLITVIKSLAAQSHSNVLLTVVAATDAPPGLEGGRLRWIRAEKDPLAAINQSLVHEDATWVGLINCGDQLADTALTFAAEAIGRNPGWKGLYTDDDCLGSDGHCHSPRLKPDFDVTLLRGMNYTDGLVMVRWDAFAALGGFDASMAGAASYDMLLKLAEKNEHAVVGHLVGPLLHRAASVTGDLESMLRAMTEHLRRSGVAATIGPGTLPESMRIDYAIEDIPLVSMIIPTRDRLPLLSRCIESILEKTAYANYEIIIVDHESRAEDTQRFLHGLSTSGASTPGESRLRVIRHQGEFSLSALFNAGARQAKGSHLVLMHDDVAVLHADWLEKLLAHVQRPGIGAVGARLLSADGKLQHAGIALGLSGTADLVGSGAALDDMGHLGRYVMEQEVTAVSAACLLVRRQAFETAGGFDETMFPVFFPDVDLCLRMAESGWNIVWTPHATLLHDGPARLAEGIRSAPLTPQERSQRWKAEQEQLLKRWLPQLARDPHYNRLYSLHMPAFRLCKDTLLARDPLPWKPLPRILAQPADRHGCGYYRISAPLAALATQERVQGWDTMEFYLPVEIERFSPDSVIFQRPYSDLQLEFIERTAKYSKSLRVFELDDLITRIPEGNVHRNAFPADLSSRLKRAAAGCDRLVVSTQPLADHLKPWHEDIRVVGNYLPSEPWSHHAPLRRTSAKPKVGWAGAYGHEGDMLMMEAVIRELADEVDWILLGSCPSILRPYIRELHDLVEIKDYPAKLAGLNLDLAIAPLEINAFNEAKSHLKLLEYGIQGYPVICTDITPYQGDYPVRRVRNTQSGWIKAIREHTGDLSECGKRGDVLRDYVRKNWMLEDHLDAWLKAWLP